MELSGGVVTELFSPPRVNQALGAKRGLGLLPGTSFDPIIDTASGEKWDFLQADHRRRCWQRLVEEDPWVVIGSPPCTSFCIINIGLKYPKMDPQKVARLNQRPKAWSS